MAISINTRTNISTDNRMSRYVQGGLSDKFSNRIGWWERYSFEKREDDLRFVIQTHQEKRPDLIAFDAYGKTSLMWLVLQYNAIVDTETELYVGRELRLPTQRRVMIEILTKQVGGNPVT
jgi:hypothetical protein